MRVVVSFARKIAMRKSKRIVSLKNLYMAGRLIDIVNTLCKLSKLKLNPVDEIHSHCK